MSRIRCPRRPCLRLRVALAACGLAAAGSAPPLAADELRLDEGTNLSVDVSPKDGRLVFDLLGGLWTLPPRGGAADRVPIDGHLAEQPRWSPDGSRILFRGRGAALWLVDADGGTPRRVSADSESVRDAAWHPDGRRIVYSAPGEDGLDLWERDLATDLAWRVTFADGDEYAAAWSADGRHLVYVAADAGGWRLVLKPFARPPRTLLAADGPLRAPAWRPDNTLVTYLAGGEGEDLSLRMLILADPPLARVLIEGEDLFATPVSWPSRGRFVYAADGQLKSRGFEERRASVIPFVATIDVPDRPAALGDRARPLPDTATAGGPMVLRAARLYPGEGRDYRHDVDVLVENGRIVAVEARAERDGMTVIDLPGTTLMPGLIDSYAAVPDTGATTAARLLAFGVTTIVTPDAEAGASFATPAGLPGPRLLLAAAAGKPPPDTDLPQIRLAEAGDRPAVIETWRRRGVPVLAHTWADGLLSGADLLLGTVSLPASPAGRRYGDIAILMNDGPLKLVSGLGGTSVPGLDALLAAPQAALLPGRLSGARGYVAPPDFVNGRADVILGSRPSGLPAGLASQAELIAMRAAGLSPAAVLHAATGGAADALGLAGEIGRIRAGARADLLFVSGDPLSDVGAAGQVVGIVVAGRFSSITGLLERVAAVE